MGKSLAASLLIVSGLLLSGCDNAKDLPLLSRYVAKNICSAHWVEGYELEASRQYVSNVAPLISSSWLASTEGNSVIVSNRWFPWLIKREASLIQNGVSAECRNHYDNLGQYTDTQLQTSNLAAAFRDNVVVNSALQKYLEAEVAIGAPEYTTGLLVLEGNAVIAEAYADGIGPQSALKGYSMSKSFANLLVGRLVDSGLIEVNQPLPIASWQQDARGAIDWHNSLRMSSGLQWHEAAVGDDNDQGQMLYNSIAPNLYASSKPLQHDVGSVYNYSSGDYMNLATALVNTSDRWFNPGWNLGEHFALEFSPDGGYPLLAEGVYLTTRGWAALARIYMKQGQLAGQQVLSPQWVQYSLSPSANNYDYGAGIWLNLGQSFFPELPADSFIFAGSHDRYVLAIPSLDLVFVRFGFSAQPGDFDMQRYVLNALELVAH